LRPIAPRGTLAGLTMTKFPDTPRGRRAQELGGRCPVHGAALEVGPGFAARMDLFPSHAFEAMQRALPFCLDLGESFEQERGSAPATVLWCPVCVAAAQQGQKIAGKE
jgi:hypothetical protein